MIIVLKVLDKGISNNSAYFSLFSISENEQRLL